MNVYDENGSLREHRQRTERQIMWRAIRHATAYTAVFITLAWLVVLACEWIGRK
jgi:hypothetical protein